MTDERIITGKVSRNEVQNAHDRILFADVFLALRFLLHQALARSQKKHLSARKLLLQLLDSLTVVDIIFLILLVNRLSLVLIVKSLVLLRDRL